MSIKKMVIKSNLKTRGLVNVETGEFIGNNSNVILQERTENLESFLIDSENYVILDITAITMIQKILSYSDFGALVYICEKLMPHYNIPMKKGDVPHTNISIAEELKVTRQAVYKIMSRLFKKNIIAYINFYQDGVNKKIITVNPTILRKGKSYDKALSYVFKDLTINDERLIVDILKRN